MLTPSVLVALKWFFPADEGRRFHFGRSSAFHFCSRKPGEHIWHELGQFPGGVRCRYRV